jgi:hypothetical protein
MNHLSLGEHDCVSYVLTVPSNKIGDCHILDPTTATDYPCKLLNGAG